MQPGARIQLSRIVNVSYTSMHGAVLTLLNNSVNFHWCEHPYLHRLPFELHRLWCLQGRFRDHSRGCGHQISEHPHITRRASRGCERMKTSPSYIQLTHALITHVICDSNRTGCAGCS
eukprot:1194191-Prorocentrum_minimum.AAC.1